MINTDDFDKSWKNKSCECGAKIFFFRKMCHICYVKLLKSIIHH